MKAVLVIDMPLSCHDCPLVSEYVCLADERVGNVLEWGRCRYPLCPLKEMPSEKDVDYSKVCDYQDGYYAEGWNACLEEIER